MNGNFVRLKFDTVFKVERIITAFYMELSKDFFYEGESHDFWEMVYIDKGQVSCTANEKRFTLKSGEITFHKPGEFHNLSGDGEVAPNITVLTFECKSRNMRSFEGRIFRLDTEEKTLFSTLFEEALSIYRMENEYDPLVQKMTKIKSAPFGASQMTKNLLEIFLIKLKRNKDNVTKEMRSAHLINGVSVPDEVEEILSLLSGSLYKRVTISEISRELGRSPSALKKQFSSVFGVGIIEYFNSMKIKEAKRLIREGKMNFQEISEALAFDTPQYFSKCFKDRTRLTPGEYKRSIMK